MKRLLDYLEDRAGVRTMIRLMLLEGVPGGARWRYVFGSMLAFTFSIQLITGILLMTAYSPSASQAWSSVHYIQYKMDFGWLIRGLHHFGSQTMMVLIGVHMLQVVIAGAQLPPREVNWWTGIGLLSVTLGLSLTGYLLPWDQKGYWATDVATNIAGSLPGLGAEVKVQAVAGPDSGNHTLTRFYGLHVAILPGALILLMIAHIAIFRRHGVTCKENELGLVAQPQDEHKMEQFFPRQAFYDLVACMVVFAVMLGLVIYGFAHKVEPPENETFYESIARAGVHGKGADLDAAADRSTPNYPARPEWYFLGLFQLLKYFPGESAIYGTVIIPNGVMLLLVLLPLFGIGPLRTFGRYFGILVMLAVLGGAAFLTLQALDDDKPDGILWGVMKDKSDEKAIKKAEGFQHAVHDAEALAARACQLAMGGSPVEGGHELIRRDPFTRGQALFKTNCGVCHGFTAQESDKFSRTFDLDPKAQEYLIKGDLGGIAKELQKKGIPLSNKVEVKTVKDGSEWRIDDNGYGRTYTIESRPSGLEGSTKSMTDGITASDLGNFGSKEWVRGLLKNPMSDHYFGLVPKRDETDADGNPVKDEKGNVKKVDAFATMKGWRERVDEERKNGKIDAAAQDKDFDKIADWLSYIGKTPKAQRKDDALIDAGQDAFLEPKKKASARINRCASCHSVEVRIKEKDGKLTWQKEENPGAPDLTDYGSAGWIRGMIMRPGHKSRYGDKNLMPAFRPKDGVGVEIGLDEFRETNAKTPDNMILELSDLDRELIIRWILRDYRPVFGGNPISK